MPLRIRWAQKEYLSIAFMLLGACGLFQVFYIFVAQYLLSIGNYIVVIIIPIGVTIALFYASAVIFGSYAQVKRRRRIKSQYSKRVLDKVRLRNFFEFPVVRPLIIIFVVFSVIFFPAYFISILWFNNIWSFIIAENAGTIACIITANLIEQRYGKVKRS